jgi:hypothetical protein
MIYPKNLIDEGASLTPLTSMNYMTFLHQGRQNFYLKDLCRLCLLHRMYHLCLLYLLSTQYLVGL